MNWVDASIRMFVLASDHSYLSVFFQEYQPLTGEKACVPCAPGNFSVSSVHEFQLRQSMQTFKLKLLFYDV